MGKAIVVLLKSTAISHAMTTSRILWPICETLHFIGLALLIGGAGLIDLRLMGFFKSIPLSAVMQMRKWAVLGLTINVVTGSLFLVGELRGAIRQSHLRPRRQAQLQPVA